MSAFATVLGILLSLAALGWLAATDAKRRRAFGLPAHARPRHAGRAWLAALLPGALVPVWSGGAGFVLWLGAVSIAGWVLAAVPPDRPAAWLAAVSSRMPSLAPVRDRGRALWQRAGIALAAARAAQRTDVAALERRIAELEAQLAELRSERAASAEPFAQPSRPLPH